jgi:hypothetical protein
MGVRVSAGDTKRGLKTSDTPQALFTPLYRSTDRLCRCGAPVKNLAGPLGPRRHQRYPEEGACGRTLAGQRPHQPPSTRSDAQREAAETYIKTQSHERWRLSAGHYDGGGYSGGSMQQPGLQKLLSDIGAGRIDVVVVYKVDRLTRSPADFAKLVELFDANKFSFVSVTRRREGAKRCASGPARTRGRPDRIGEHGRRPQADRSLCRRGLDGEPVTTLERH